MAKKRAISLTDNVHFSLVYEPEPWASSGLQIQIARRGKRSLIEVYLNVDERVRLSEYLNQKDDRMSILAPAKVRKIRKARP